MQAFEVAAYETGDNAYTPGFTYYSLGAYLQVKLNTGFYTIATVVSPQKLQQSYSSGTSSKPAYDFNGHKLKSSEFDGQRVNQGWSYREKAE